MAVRLNVIMVHGTPPTATAQRVAQSIVGELIGLAGIDLTLVDRLKEIQPTSTDFLTLDSITSDVAVLDWQSPDSTIDSLSAIGFVGSRTRHAHDLQGDAAARSRRIYAFNLCEFDDGQNVIAALREILTHRQVKTVSLGGLPLADKRPNPAVAANSPNSDSSQGSGQANQGSNPPTVPMRAVAESEPAPQPRPKQTLDLDELVDQLDLLDQ